VLATVVDAECQTNELRQDRRATAPDLITSFAAAATTGRIGLLEQVAIDERPLPDRRAMTRLSPSSCERDGSTR
jgi:hypothetical protein